MCIYIYIIIYMYMYMYIYVYIYIYIRIYIYIYTHVYIYIQLYICLCKESEILYHIYIYITLIYVAWLIMSRIWQPTQAFTSCKRYNTTSHLQDFSGLSLHLLLNSHPSGHNSPECGAPWLAKLILVIIG